MSLDLRYRTDLDSMNLIVYAHGINGFKDWGGMDLIADKFAAEGFAFAKFNFSHNGTTPARPTEFADLEAYREDTYLKRQFDLEAILSFLDSHLKDTPIKTERPSLIGHSRGGADCILFAANSPKIKALITWASVAHARTPWNNLDADEIKEWKINGFYTRKNGRTKQDMPIGYGLFNEYQSNKDFLDLERAARSINVPWLIIHGDEDEAVFVKDAYDLKSWNTAAEAQNIPDTGHTFGRKHPWPESKLPEASIRKVDHSLEFLKRVL